MNTYKRHRFPPDIIPLRRLALLSLQSQPQRHRRSTCRTRHHSSAENRSASGVSSSVALYLRLKRKHRGYGDTFYIDEVFVKINGKQHYLWRAVDQDGEVVDVYLQAKRDGAAAKRFFKRLLRSHGSEPRKIVTDKLRSESQSRCVRAME